MSTPSDAPPPDRQKRFFLIWAITASVVAFVLANLVIVLLVRQGSVTEEAQLSPTAAEATPDVTTRASRPRGAPAPEGVPPAYPTRGEPLTRAINSSFTNLVEGDVAGRYRFFEESGEVGIITLLPDHTMLNKEGMALRQYRWEIQPDGIMTHWRRFDIRFNDIEKPGVYVARREDGAEYSRLEKVRE